MKRNLCSISLVVLHFFLAIGAFAGGIMFIVDPSGALAGLSVDLLAGSFLTSFFIPGLLLLVVFGLLPTAVGIALLNRWDFALAEMLNIYKDKHWSWTFSLYIGFALIIWITIQVAIIKELSLLHFIFIVYGLVLQIVTLLPSVQRIYDK